MHYFEDNFHITFYRIRNDPVYMDCILIEFTSKVKNLISADQAVKQAKEERGKTKKANKKNKTLKTSKVPNVKNVKNIKNAKNKKVTHK